MLSWIAVHVERGRIETDLESRATLALRTAGHGWASIVFSGRDGVLVGTAPRREAAVEALALARGVWGARVVEGRTRLAAREMATTLPLRAALPPIAATVTVIESAEGHIADAPPFTVAASAPAPIAEPHPDAVSVSEPTLTPDDEPTTDAQKPQEAAPRPTVETAAIAATAEAAAQTCQAAVRAINVAEPVRFERGKTELDGHGRSVLEQLVATAGSCPDVGLRVVGHADARGRAKRNLVLSQRRARAVVTYLIDKGIDAGRLEAVGYGEARPVAPNDTAQNRAKNRRIELEIKGP
jgi:outer membrane protein OmpA-like peptidoglycan-associated protein